jgi:hypothetical protein
MGAADQSLSESRQVIVWCDLENKEAGKIRLKWLQTQPEDDPDIYIGINPDTSTLVGPSFRIGRKYRIIYSSPVRLPFNHPQEGPAAYHVAEIIGTIINPFQMADVECIICAPSDYSIKEKMHSSKSQFRLYIGDCLEPVD